MKSKYTLNSSCMLCFAGRTALKQRSINILMGLFKGHFLACKSKRCEEDYGIVYLVFFSKYVFQKDYGNLERLNWKYL